MYLLNVHKGDRILYTDEFILFYTTLIEGLPWIQNKDCDTAYIHSLSNGEPIPILTITKIDTPPYIRFNHHDEPDPPDTLEVSETILRTIKTMVDACLQTLEARRGK